MQTRDMTHGKPLRLIISVALPLMLGDVFQQIYTVVDAAVVGRVEGVTALAALGTSDWYTWMILAVIQGLSQGFAIPLAQAFGARDEDRLRRIVGSAIPLAALYALAVTLLAQLTVVPVLRLMSAPDEVMPIARLYLRIYYAGCPVMMAYNVMASMLRSLGNGKAPFLAVAVAAVVNIALDILFVRFFGWGVAGAAGATVFAQIISCLICYLALRKIPCLRPGRENIRLDGALAKQAARLGLPTAFQSILVACGGMWLQSIVNRMGVAFIAGFTATNKLYGSLEMAGLAFGNATAAYAGQNAGAAQRDGTGDYGRIRTGVKQAMLAGVATAALIFCAVLLVGKWAVLLFLSGSEQEVADALRYGMSYLIILAASLPLLYTLHVSTGALRGMGNTLTPMCSGIVELAMRITTATFLPRLIGYSGIFFAETAAFLGAGIVTFTALARTLRRGRVARRGNS